MNRLLLVYSLSLFCYFSNAQNVALKQIKVKGNNFVTSDNKPFIFRGLNTSDPDNLIKKELWNKAYFQEIKNRPEGRQP